MNILKVEKIKWKIEEFWWKFEEVQEKFTKVDKNMWYFIKSAEIWEIWSNLRKISGIFNKFLIVLYYNLNLNSRNFHEICLKVGKIPLKLESS